MYTLKFKVQNKELKIISEDDKKEPLIKDSFNIDKLEFDFSEEWDKLSKKVIYKVGDKSYAEAVIDNEAIVPKEVYASAGLIEISVVGFANENGKDTVVLPTNTVRKLIYDTNSTGEDPANLPDESSWNEYQKKIEDLAEEAKKAEANAKTSAASAENVKNEVEKSVDGFDENVEKKTAEFNKNAEEKTTEFNKNTEQLYKDIESLESLAPLLTEAGTTINVDNAKAYKMLRESIDGKYEQGENPSPDSPQEITQINSVTLKRCGKNIANPRGVSWTYNGITVEKLSEGRYKVNGTSTGAFDYAIFGNRKIYLTKDKYYKLSRIVWSGTTTGAGLSNCRLITPTTSTWAWLQSRLPTAKKAPEDSYIDLIVLAIGNNVTFTNYVFSVQLEEVENANSPATSYETYNSQSINIDLDGNEICALSDAIKDKLIIDKKGNVVLKKNVEKFTLTGNEEWNVNSTYGCFAHKIDHIINKKGINSISNLFVETDIEKLKNNANYGIYTKYTSSIIVGYPNATLEEFKAFLNNNNLIVYCCLDEPEIIELPKLAEPPKTLEGINHICAETNLGTTKIEVTYVEDLQKEIEKIQNAIVALGGVE